MIDYLNALYQQQMQMQLSQMIPCTNTGYPHAGWNYNPYSWGPYSGPSFPPLEQPKPPEKNRRVVCKEFEWLKARVKEILWKG